MTILVATGMVLVLTAVLACCLHRKVASMKNALAKADKRAKNLEDLLNEMEKTRGVTRDKTLELAKHISRVENNLFLMKDDDRRRNLARAVDNMKSILSSEGYEMADIIGRNYSKDMDANVVFIHDDTLPVGSIIVVSVQRPIIKFKGNRLQSGHVTVGENLPCPKTLEKGAGSGFPMIPDPP